MSDLFKPKVAILGATGAVGREIISILAEKRFPLSSLTLYASKKSADEEIEYMSDTITVKELVDPKEIDAHIIFVAIPSHLAKKAVPFLLTKDCFIIDKSSAFREDDRALLIVPEVNGEKINLATRLVASPNCVAVPLALVLKPIGDAFGIKQIVVSTYQAVSGAGKKATDELESQVRDLFNLREISCDIFKKPIAFNILPFIPDEEEKIVSETKKLLEIPELLMDVTAVRVPVFNGHSMSVHMELKKSPDINAIRELLKSFSYLHLEDDVSNLCYPNPMDASGKDETMVGRIRVSKAFDNGLSLFISSDNLRTGAALNAVKIAQRFLKIRQGS